MDTINPMLLLMLLLCLCKAEDQSNGEFKIEQENSNDMLNKDYNNSPISDIHPLSSNSIIEKRSAMSGADFLQNAQSNTLNDKTSKYLYQPFIKDDNEYTLLLSDLLNKRRVPPLGFYNGRGKKDDNLMGPFDEDGDNVAYFDEYPKRRNWGFVGMRGRRDLLEDDDLSTFLEEKRKPPKGFFAMRGKKQLPTGFFAMRGKRVPADNLKVVSDYSGNNLDGEILNLKRLLFYTPQANKNSPTNFWSEHRQNIL